MATQTGSYDFKAAKQAKLSAEATAAADATTKANDAKKVATNFIATDSSGMMVYDGTSGTHTPTNPGANTSNVLIDSDSVDVRQGTDVLATFGSPTRIGKANETNVTIASNRASFNTNSLASAVVISSEEADGNVYGEIDIGGSSDGLESYIRGYTTADATQGDYSTGVSMQSDCTFNNSISTANLEMFSYRGDNEPYSNVALVNRVDNEVINSFELNGEYIYASSKNLDIDGSLKVKDGGDLYVQSRITQGAHPESTDFNDFTKTGLYLCASMADNKPATVTSYMLICIFNNAGSGGVQLALSTGSSYLYKRHYSSGSWSAWRRVQFAEYTNP